jgi:hypothetical protein
MAAAAAAAREAVVGGRRRRARSMGGSGRIGIAVVVVAGIRGIGIMRRLRSGGGVIFGDLLVVCVCVCESSVLLVVVVVAHTPFLLLLGFSRGYPRYQAGLWGSGWDWFFKRIWTAVFGVFVFATSSGSGCPMGFTVMSWLLLWSSRGATGSAYGYTYLIQTGNTRGCKCFFDEIVGLPQSR